MLTHNPRLIVSSIRSFLSLPQSTLECAIHRHPVTIINAHLLPLPAVVTHTPIRTLCLDAIAPTVTLMVRTSLTFAPTAIRTAAPIPAPALAIRTVVPAPANSKAFTETIIENLALAMGASPPTTAAMQMHP
jgi:hypothetical protein